MVLRPLLFVLATLPFPITTAVYVPKYPFLYAIENNKNASFPVIEHLSRTHRGLDEDEEDRPDFLYASNTQGYRIVEYYIHWCNTCKLFKTVYRSFAVKIKELAELQGIHIDIYAVSCSPNRKLCVDQGLKGFPKIRLYKPDETDYFELSHHMHLSPLTVLKELGVDFDGQGDEEGWDVESAMASNESAPAAEYQTVWRKFVAYLRSENFPDPKTAQPYYHRTRENLNADIHLSFDYSMRHEIYSSSSALTIEEQRVLRQWLELLANTLPSSWKLVALINELIDNFIYIVKSEDYLVAVLDEYPSARESWSLACSHGGADEGYTCGLWELFHAMTVGLVDYNKAAFDPAKVQATETAARSLRDYVDTFFGCNTCRQNFVAMYDACAHERCDQLSNEAVLDDETAWMQLPLWLYVTHNAVNVRLMKEKAARENRADITDEDILAVQWPPQHECGACWQENDDGITWKTEMVYKFLRLEYGQRDAFTADLRRELTMEQVMDKDEEKARSTSPSPLLIQLSHAGVFVLSVVVLNLSSKVQRQKK